MAERFLCRDCSKTISATKNDRYRTHTDKNGDNCVASSMDIPPDLLEQGPSDPKASKDTPVKGEDFEVCPQCDRSVKLTRLGYFEPHNPTLYGGERCKKSGVRAFHAKKTDDVELPESPIDESVRPNGAKPPSKDLVRLIGNELTTSTAPTSTDASAESSPTEPLPSSGPEQDEGKLTELLREELGALVEPTTFLQPGPVPDADSPASTEESSPESRSTSEPSGPQPLYGGRSGNFLQPGSPFLQPPEWTGTPKPEEMGDLAKELATKIKETFYSYSNRKTKDNRSAQTTLGPSEIGTPCDRRLAMALMGIAPVNPGGDGWAAFVGTCTHEGMAQVYTFADAGTGRYAVELPVFLGTPTVPRGTTDLLDRRDGTIVDWKIMGAYSLKKFKAEGPTPTYRTQAHVYGLGAERGGEKVRNVAIAGLPRAGSSLDEMHVWTEKFDKKFAQAALDRVGKIAQSVADFEQHGTPMEIARRMPPADDCTYCPFYLKGDKEMERGCPGK